MDAPVRLCLRTGNFVRDGREPIKQFTLPFLVLALLLAHQDRPVFHDKLLDGVYGNCRTPDGVYRVMITTICRLRRWLEGSGWEITNLYGRSYQLHRPAFEFRGVTVPVQDRQPEQCIA